MPPKLWAHKASCYNLLHWHECCMQAGNFLAPRWFNFNSNSNSNSNFNFNFNFNFVENSLEGVWMAWTWTVDSLVKAEGDTNVLQTGEHSSEFGKRPLSVCLPNN